MRIYRTIQGDTWDMIAYREYKNLGGERLMHELIQANSEYINFVKFPAGIILNIPEIEIPVVNTLPPWKE